MEKLKNLISFVFSNFGPVLVFYAVQHFRGIKVAIVVSVIFTGLEIFARVRKKQVIPPLFKFSAGMTLLFGAVDLYAQQPSLLRYEASISNVMTGLFFGASIFAEKTVLQEFRESNGAAIPMTRDRVAYFKLLTGVWTLYFFVKAGLYYYLVSKLTLEGGIVVRAILGSATFYALLFISIAGSKRIFPALKKWGLLPQADPVTEASTP